MGDDLSLPEIKRTILYYPTISIPSGKWLRQVLLYFDEVASIVPRVVYFSGEASDLLIPLTPDIEYLRAEGVFRPIPPERLFLDEEGRESWVQAHDFMDEVESAVTSTQFTSLLNEKTREKRYVRVHIDKLSGNVMGILERTGALKDERWGESDWVQIEENTALLYMSILAKYLADLDLQATVPGTDRKEYESLIYDASSQVNAFACLDTRFLNVLPIPREDVPFSDILEFKQRRQSELLRFRKQLDQLRLQLSKAENRRDLKDILVKFQEKIQIELNDISDLFQSDNIPTIAGSFKTLVSLKSPALLGTILTASGVVENVAKIPLNWTLFGIGVAGIIQVGGHLIDKGNERRAELRESDFAIFHYGRQEGIF
jgi:hypothetical protein